MQLLRVLLLEDSESDAELILRELKKSGFEVLYDRVETENDFVSRLSPSLDAIISDHKLPSFTGLRALEIVRGQDLRVPFLLVSGTVGEEIAVTAIRNGAADYVMKDRLTRLGAAVRRAIDDRRLR